MHILEQSLVRMKKWKGWREQTEKQKSNINAAKCVKLENTLLHCEPATTSNKPREREREQDIQCMW